MTLSTDLELQDFIVARIDRMTFVQIAAEVADHFPPERCVRKTAIHAW